MLYKICTNLAVMKALAQTTESEIGVGKYRSISFLDDELIQERKASRNRVAVSLITISIEARSYRQCGRKAFEIYAGGVTGRV